MIGSNGQMMVTTTTVATACPTPSRAVLLVDDEVTIRSALRRFFTRRGWNVGEAEDGEHARQLLLEGAVPGGGYHAVITDMRMPRLTGMALHEAVARRDASLAQRFIFASGDTGDEDAVEFLSRTRCPVIPKPFDLALLLAMAERTAAAAERPSS